MKISGKIVCREKGDEDSNEKVILTDPSPNRIVSCPDPAARALRRNTIALIRKKCTLS
jgi:hypothetical protein